MGMISDLQMSVRKVSWPDGLRTFYDVTWIDAKGRDGYKTSQNFYEMLGLFKELLPLTDQELEDPRDNQFMSDHYN